VARNLTSSLESGLPILISTRRSFLLIAVATVSPVAIAQSAKLDFSPIETAANAELRSTNTPGAAIGIVQSGRLIYARGFGTRNLETGDPVTEQTLFRLGSTTKMLTASAVASLAAEGKIDFTDPVGKHIRGLDAAIAALTVNQILSHTSGLKDEAIMNGRHDDAALGDEIRRWNSDWLFTKPGAIYSYANPGFWLAGLLVETVAGKPYADLMDEIVFRPVGMTWTTLRPTMAMTRTFSQGHDMVDNRVSVLRPAPDNSANWPAGSVFSNLVDLARFTTAMMNDGRIDGKQVLSHKVIAALTSPHADVPGSKTKYGYGLDLDETGNATTWSHGGSRAGYGSFIAMMPARQQAVILLCNRTGESLPKTRAQILQLLGNPAARNNDIGPGTAIDGSEFSQYVGSYRNGATTLEIIERDGKLMVRGDELQKASDGWLILKSAQGEPAGRLFAIRDANGRIEYIFRGGRSLARVQR
jgi:CubicO group peptidase (beta-lactamase class C family)